MFDITVVLLSLVAMIFMLIKGYMRAGLILFSVVVLLLACGVITTEDALIGFSNKGMITVALLFLISEGVSRNQALMPIVNRILPTKRCSIRRSLVTILPTVSAISAFMNNTPIVVIFTPYIKSWCSRKGLPLKKFLIPLSYAAILGGMCTLIGTSTNLVVHGLMLDAGFSGFTLFELGKVGVIIAIAGIGYILLLGPKRLPNDSDEITPKDKHIVQAVLSSRFPGIECSMSEFDFRRHYGADIIAVQREGVELDQLDQYRFRENDTLILSTDSNFIDNWGESRVFLILTNGTEHYKPSPRWKRILSLLLLIVMVVGAAISDTNFIGGAIGSKGCDMFFWAAIITVIMALCNIFPAKSYTKYISWDILITIASALAISRAMILSGLAEWMAWSLIDLCSSSSPHLVLAALYLTTNLITELITNNAAAAFAFPIALSAAQGLGVSPMPFFVAISIAASASFCTPIGYQTNMIVQSLGRYSFADFIRIGLPLSIITFTISMIFIPLFWKF